MKIPIATIACALCLTACSMTPTEEGSAADRGPLQFEELGLRAGTVSISDAFPDAADPGTWDVFVAEQDGTTWVWLFGTWLVATPTSEFGTFLVNVGGHEAELGSLLYDRTVGAAPWWAQPARDVALSGVRLDASVPVVLAVTYEASGAVVDADLAFGLKVSGALVHATALTLEATGSSEAELVWSIADQTPIWGELAVAARLSTVAQSVPTIDEEQSWGSHEERLDMRCNLLTQISCRIDCKQKCGGANACPGCQHQIIGCLARTDPNLVDPGKFCREAYAAQYPDATCYDINGKSWALPGDEDY